MSCGQYSLADLLLCHLLYVMTVNYVLATVELQTRPGYLPFPGQKLPPALLISKNLYNLISIVKLHLAALYSQLTCLRECFLQTYNYDIVLII